MGEHPRPIAGSGCQHELLNIFNSWIHALAVLWCQALTTASVLAVVRLIDGWEQSFSKAARQLRDKCISILVFTFLYPLIPKCFVDGINSHTQVSVEVCRLTHSPPLSSTGSAWTLWMQRVRRAMEPGLSPDQIRALLKAETMFHIHIRVSHKSFIQVLMPISFILTRLWILVLVPSSSCVWARAIEYDLPPYVLRILMD